MEGHDSDLETAVSGPDLSLCFSPLAPQPMDCPNNLHIQTYTEQHVEIRAVLCNVDGSSEAHLQDRTEPVNKKVTMCCHLENYPDLACAAWEQF